MSKKKEMDEVDSVDVISQLKKDINKKYETNVMINAQEIVEKERQVVSVSPALDIALCGGIVSGSWLLLSGTPKCGKSTLALQIAANAQQQYGKDIFIGNVEHRLNKKEFQGIHNLDISKVHVIQSQKNKILMSQDFLQEFTSILKSVENCVLIIDSSSALCAQNEYSSDSSASFRNEGPKLLANFCRKMASVVPAQNAILIVISHLLANTSGYGSPFYEDGGNKLQYQGDTKLRCSSFQKWELTKGDESTRVGQAVTWSVLTSSLGPPMGKVQSYLRYGYGIDDIKEYGMLAMDFGIISKGGAWYSIQYNGKEYKYQGEEKLRDGLIENPELLEYIKQQLSMHLV